MLLACFVLTVAACAPRSNDSALIDKCKTINLAEAKYGDGC